MAEVICTASGYMTSRKFERGYRLAGDKCEVCGSPLRRANAADHDASQLARDSRICQSHACVGKNVKLVRGSVREHILFGSYIKPMPVAGPRVYENSFSDEVNYYCQACQHVFKFYENFTREVVQ